jgi:hypothetical protein
MYPKSQNNQKHLANVYWRLGKYSQAITHM